MPHIPIYIVFNLQENLTLPQARQFFRDTFPSNQDLNPPSGSITVSGLDGDYCIFRGCIIDDDDDEIYNFKEQRNCSGKKSKNNQLNMFYLNL